MEVAKLIVNVARSKANMTLSVKPFGCMPSSGVSDGVQSLITEKFPGSIYCAVETSGDGAVSFYSRVQMYLFKAKRAAQAEFDKALSDAGLTLEQVRGFIQEHPRYGHALHRAPHTAASTAADLINEIASVYGKPAWKVALEKMQVIAGRVTSAGRTAVVIAPPALKGAAGVTAQGVVELAGIAKERLLKRESTMTNVAAAAG
jgi:hypothetical protein